LQEVTSKSGTDAKKKTQPVDNGCRLDSPPSRILDHVDAQSRLPFEVGAGDISTTKSIVFRYICFLRYRTDAGKWCPLWECRFRIWSLSADEPFMGWVQVLLVFVGYLVGTYGYFGVFLVELISTSSIFVPIPGFLSTMAAASVLDPLAVGICAGSGAAIGELTIYLLGLGGRKIVQDRVKLATAESMYRRYGLWSIYLFAALPFPFDIIGIACGLLKIDVRVFFLMTWLGKMTSRVMLALTGKASLVIVMELISGRVDTLSLVFLLFAVGLMLASLLYWVFHAR